MAVTRFRLTGSLLSCETRVIYLLPLWPSTEIDRLFFLQNAIPSKVNLLLISFAVARQPLLDFVPVCSLNFPVVRKETVTSCVEQD